MRCEICNQKAEFICACENIYICSRHLGEHFLLESANPHQVTKLKHNLDQFEESMLKTELLNRINLLKLYNQSLISKTSELIEMIVKSSNKKTKLV